MAPDTYRRRAWELAMGQYGYVTAADARTHDIPMAEMDGQHAKSIDCPCGTDIEEVTLGRTAIVYHQRRTPSKRWQR